MPIDAPRLEHALHVAVLAGPPDVVHDLVLPSLGQGCPNPPRDVVQRGVPRDALPLARSARPAALHRIEDALGIVDLVDRRWPLGAVASTAAGMERVPLQLADLHRFL